MRNQRTLPQKLRIDDLLTFEAITGSQEKVYDAWYKEGNHLMMVGTAGTGKTFTAMYLGLEECLDKSNSFERVTVVRSVVPTREIGFLPGSIEEKINTYNAPYKAICTELFDDSEAYDKLTNQGAIEFMSTSFIRGVTLTDTILVIDEIQNMSFHELDSIITRVGRNCRVIFAGDYKQSDFTKETDKKGLLKFMDIIDNLNRFTVVEFTWADIVRSDFVRDYIMTKDMLGIE